MIEEALCICIPEPRFQTLASLWTEGLANLSLFRLLFFYGWGEIDGGECGGDRIFPVANSHCICVFIICTDKAAGGRKMNPGRGMGLLDECSQALLWKVRLTWMSYEPWRATIYSCDEYDVHPSGGEASCPMPTLGLREAPTAT